MVERSLHGRSRCKLEKAGCHLMDELPHCFSDDYSREEMSRVVIHAFDKRLNEYADSFAIRAGEGARITALDKQGDVAW